MTPLFAGLWLGLSSAFAADDGLLRPEGTDCDLNGGAPIAGTAGFANALDALQTNQNTWSATAFAERTLFPTAQAAKRAGAKGQGKEPDEDDLDGVFAAQWTFTFNAAQVVTLDDSAGTANCPENYRVQVRPLDMQAGNLGFTLQGDRWGFFYSSSITFGQLAYPNPAVRAMGWLGAMPLYAGTLSVLAPISGGWTTQEGASALAMDWIAGARYEGDAGHVRMGYAGSRGLYVDAGEDKVGLGLSGVLRSSEAGWLGQLLAGGRRMPLRKVWEPAGFSSVYLRDLPYGPPVRGGVLEAAAEGGLDQVLGGVGRLRTVHLDQEDIAERVDLSVALTTRPVSSVHMATLGVHSRDFRGDRAGSTGTGLLARAGMVNLPAQPVFGQAGGTLFSARLEGRIGNKKSQAGASVLFNDPELLALYPFASNVSSWSIYGRGQF